MVALAAAVALLPWSGPTAADALDGEATYYAPGVMARVATNRGYIREPGEYHAWLNAGGYVGAVALNRAGDLGRVVWIEGPAGIEGPFVVLDCAERVHYAARERAARVVEVDWATAARWGMDGPVPVRVFFSVPDAVMDAGRHRVI